MLHSNPHGKEHGRSRNGAPIVWLLIDDRPGHRTQVQGLARWLGWRGIETNLVFNWLNRLPNPLLGASLSSLNLAKSDRLDAPFPDLVIGMGRRVVPVARWIKQQSGGHSQIVLLGRKAANASNAADLSVACAHFQLLPHDAMVELVVPPTQVDSAALESARQTHGDPLDGLARPRVLLLVGGPTVQHRFDAAFAGEMAKEVAAGVHAQGGSLSIVTSRRTPATAVAAMRSAAPGAHVHEWQKDSGKNPFLAYLAAADLIVVTGESESMLAEAAATATPLTIYPLVQKPDSIKQSLARWLRRTAGGHGPGAAFCQALFAGGWMTPPRDLNLMHSLMVASGRAGMFGDGLNTDTPGEPVEGRQLADRVRVLVGYNGNRG